MDDQLNATILIDFVEVVAVSDEPGWGSDWHHAKSGNRICNEPDFASCVDSEATKCGNLRATEVVLRVGLNLWFVGCYPPQRIVRGSGEIGRRARLRGVWGNPCRFKSCLPQFPSV